MDPPLLRSTDSSRITQAFLEDMINRECVHNDAKNAKLQATVMEEIESLCQDPVKVKSTPQATPLHFKGAAKPKPTSAVTGENMGKGTIANAKSQKAKSKTAKDEVSKLTEQLEQKN